MFICGGIKIQYHPPFGDFAERDQLLMKDSCHAPLLLQVWLDTNYNEVRD